MLKDVQFPERPEEEELKIRLKAAREKLQAQQLRSRNIRHPYLFWWKAGERQERAA